MGLLVCASLASGVAAADRIGKPVKDFSLKSHLGKEYSLHDFADHKVVVMAFVGTECPLAKLYGPRLAELAAKYGPRGWRSSASTRIARTRSVRSPLSPAPRGIEFPLLKDLKNAVAGELGATRTPEVFVLDKDRVVRYSGRIDDRSGVGYVRDKIDHDYLAAALDRLLAGKAVETAHVDAVGCLIGTAREPDARSDVTYSKQIARIFQDHCVSCHRPGEIGPFALNDYSEAAGWADMIEEVVRAKRMPPWHADPKYGHFRNDISLSDADKETIYQVGRRRCARRVAGRSAGPARICDRVDPAAQAGPGLERAGKTVRRAGQWACPISIFHHRSGLHRRQMDHGQPDHPR